LVPQAFNLKRFLIPNVRHEFGMVKTSISHCSLVLNQDLQDFQDFLNRALFGRVRAAAYESFSIIQNRNHFTP
jgi:hypothetical protein